MPPRACIGSTRTAPHGSAGKKFRARSKGGKSASLLGKGAKRPKRAQLRLKRRAEKVAVGGVERAVAQPVIAAGERHHPLACP